MRAMRVFLRNRGLSPVIQRGMLIINQHSMRKVQMKKPCQVPVYVTNRHVNPGRFFWLSALLLVIVAFTQLPASAQFASGSIGATVTDSTGAAIPAAKAVLKNEATGALRESTTNGSGYFDFPSILPGTYSVTVSAPGLRTAEQTGIVLNQGATLRLSTIVLQVQTQNGN